LFFKTAGAVGNTLMGKGSLKDNMEFSFKGMQPFELKLEDVRLNDDGTGPWLKAIMGKGLFPLERNANLTVVTSVFDETSGELEPVISALDSFQEPDSVAYQANSELGYVKAGTGFVKWVRLGVAIPDIIEPPYSGKRKLLVIVRVVDVDNLPKIEHGFHTSDTGIIFQTSLRFEHEFLDKGYIEAAEHKEESVALSLKIGMAVAMADGSLDDAEGDVLKHWIIKSIAPFKDEKKNRLKGIYNEAIRDSYAQALEGSLSLSQLTDNLNNMGDKTGKYEALELCFEVMAADGVADSEEIKIIHKVADALNLDMKEVEAMRDQKILGLKTKISDNDSVEVILGIDDSWSHEQIKRHLRTEFQKWNNRLNTLPEGEERNSAQVMLNQISEARKKYA
jgi:tellurite resistance protein